MTKVRIFHDKRGNTLTVWFDDPKKEHVCEEIAGDIVLMKDKKGSVIGMEKLNYATSKTAEYATFPFEIISA